MVWEVLGDRAVVLIIGIGKRDKGEIYLTVARRLAEREKS